MGLKVLEEQKGQKLDECQLGTRSFCCSQSERLSSEQWGQQNLQLHASIPIKSSCPHLSPLNR